MQATGIVVVARSDWDESRKVACPTSQLAVAGPSLGGPVDWFLRWGTLATGNLFVDFLLWTNQSRLAAANRVLSTGPVRSPSSVPVPACQVHVLLTFPQSSALPILISVLFMRVALLASNWTIFGLPIPLASVLQWEIPTTLPPDPTAYASPVTTFIGPRQDCSTTAARP